MRRKQDVESLKKKQTTKQQTFDYSYDTQISILLPYLKMMPITMRSKFLIGLKQIAERETVYEANRTTVENMFAFSVTDGLDYGRNVFLVDAFCRFLKLNKLRDYFSAMGKKNSSRDRQQENSFDRDMGTGPLAPFEPNIQRQNTKFQPMPHVINPNYENIIKMYKNFTDIHMNMEYKIKELNEGYKFFAPPRFISKVLEMHDFQSGFSEKGNIVMMSFEGSKITGQRGFAFISNSAIYWWEKNYKDAKDIMPDINVEQKDDKDKSKKKQSQKQQQKNQEPEVPKFTQNFKLTCKLVGHHGKITSLSLSDDEYYLISAGTDRMIKLWCLRQKCLLAEYRGHMKTIWSVSFSKSGYFFLSGSADRTMKLWSTDDSIAQRVYTGHQDDVTKVDFLKNPDLIASASEDKTVRIWNTLTTECMNTLRFDQSILNFKTSISGRYFITCDITGKMSLYDLLKGQSISAFRVPEKSEAGSGQVKYLKIHDMCFSMDQKQFACVSSKYIVIYSLDKICERQSKNLFSESGRDSNERAVATKEVIYTGRDSNLVYCDYHDKGLLLVATTSTKKY